MASLDMIGPHDLTAKEIERVVTQESAGNYALGEVSDSTFYVRYVGRSDDDVASRLKSWVGESKRYKSFKYSYASSAKAAFEKESKNYHDFGEKEKLDNKEHPQRPKGTNWKCPVCDIYG